MSTTNNITNASVHAVIIKADGTRVELGKIADVNKVSLMDKIVNKISGGK